jgi:hypothetical protein
MKTKILGGITILAIVALSAMNVNLESIGKRYFSVAMINIEALADDENDCPDDEQSFCMKGECSDGKNCECEACMRGSTDCTPTCPCC